MPTDNHEWRYPPSSSSVSRIRSRIRENLDKIDKLTKGFDNDGNSLTLERSKLNPTDIRQLELSEDDEGTEAYHDGSGENTSGPVVWKGDKWVLLVDSTVIQE